MRFNRTILIALTMVVAAISAQAQTPRTPGKWERILLNPGVGRIHHMVYDPNDGDSLYINPDGDGIWYTSDLGKNWRCVTDNIPVTADRVAHKNIMADPDHFKTLYYIAESGAYYITEDQGKNWKRVTKDGKPVTLPLFRRAIVARGKDGTLVMTATVNSKPPKGGVYTSRDKGMTWNHFPSPSSKEFFYEIAFEPGNPNVIYAPTQLHLYKSTDCGKTFKVIYTYTGPAGGYSHIDVSERNPKTLWLNTTKDRSSGIYRSDDGGKTWTTIQDMKKKIGWGQFIWYGKNANNWVHCFSVNSNNPKEMLTGAIRVLESHDGGKTWVKHNNRAISDKRPEGKGRPAGRLPDGSVTSHPYAHHLADNHCVVFHPKYKHRVYRCCDTGFYVRDPEIGLDSFTNITGNIGSFLMRNITVSEFDDHYMIGNSQDLGVETFQYGKWWGARGYEGDSAIIYPYTNFAYYPFGGKDCEIMNLREVGQRGRLRAWGRPSLAVNYQNPDEGLMLFKGKDSNGRSTERQLRKTTDRLDSVKYIPLPGKADALAACISRTPEQRYTAFSENTIFQSLDHGKTWKNTGRLPGRATFGASDPSNPDRSWICTKNGKVFRTVDNGKSWKDISDPMFAGLSGVKLIYHEGSKEDLYYLTKAGVYFRDSDKLAWRRWTQGFPLPAFSDISIDYARQKMMGSHFGRGAFQADLERVCERFLYKSPAIALRSRQNDRTVFEVDTPMFLPEYYHYRWTVNGKSAGQNSRIFHGLGVKANDVIECSLSPRNFPKIQTSCKKHTVSPGTPPKASKTTEKALSSSSGQVCLGYFDYFGPRQDVTLAFNINAQSDGVVLGNRYLSDHDAKGVLIAVEGDELIVKYGAQFNQRTFDDDTAKDSLVSTEKIRVAFAKNTWNQVKLVIKRGSYLHLYINGKLAGKAALDASEAQYSFNGVFDLSLFADAKGQNSIKATIDELKIWSIATDSKATEPTGSLSQSERLYYSFDASSLAEVKERYTGKKIQVRGTVRLAPVK